MRQYSIDVVAISVCDHVGAYQHVVEPEDICFQFDDYYTQVFRRVYERLVNSRCIAG